MQREIELKFNVPLYQDIGELVDLVSSRVEHDIKAHGKHADKIAEPFTRVRAYYYFDDDKLSVLHDNATIREIYGIGTFDRPYRIQFKQGRIDDRFESEADHFAKYVPPEEIIKCLKIPISKYGPLSEVARSDSMHLKWFLKHKGIEIKLDRFNVYGGNSFGELEFEWKGDEPDKAIKHLKQFVEPIASKLKLQEVNVQKYARVMWAKEEYRSKIHLPAAEIDHLMSLK